MRDETKELLKLICGSLTIISILLLGNWLFFSVFRLVFSVSVSVGLVITSYYLLANKIVTTIVFPASGYYFRRNYEV